MSKTKVFKGGKLFDGTGADIIENSVVVMEDKKITAAGTAGNVKIPEGPGVDVIDTTGKFVLPGLIESHLHICNDPSVETGKPAASCAIMMNNLEMMMRSIPRLQEAYKMGFTTIRDGGSGWGWIEVALRDAFERGDVEGPRYSATGYHITVTGGHGAFMPYNIGRHGIEEMAACYADGADDWRKKARINIWNKVDNLKLVASRGFSGRDKRQDPCNSLPTVEEMRAAADQAHAVNIPIMSHANGRQAILKSIEAGVTIIVHGFWMDDECASKMAEKGIYWDPTNAIMWLSQLAIDGKLPPSSLKAIGGAPKIDLENYKKDLDCWEDKVKNFHKIVKKSGVKVLTGTDAGCGFFAHGDNALEFEADVKLGMSAREVLLGATRFAAESMNRYDEIGSVEAGKKADLLVVDGNPLDNISLLRDPANIRMVVRDGRWIVHK